jgi:hypothetical protein
LIRIAEDTGRYESAGCAWLHEPGRLGPGASAGPAMAKDRQNWKAGSLSLTGKAKSVLLTPRVKPRERCFGRFYGKKMTFFYRTVEKGIYLAGFFLKGLNDANT